MDSNRFKRLAGILTEQTTVNTVGNVRVYDEQAKALLQKYCGWLRAIHLWFHGAHHITRGTNFAGDHGTLYSRIYTEVQNEVDGAIEKVVGVTNEHNLACPIEIIRQAEIIMEKYGSPADVPLHLLPSVGLELEKGYIDFVERLFKHLEAENLVTLGLNDQLAASANAHETYVYLLQQRMKNV